ncbi:MAG: hypothetical protein NW214_14510 [Pseudanabaenaceae cyanobacterium bins.39]|nr:hypothetical protein [Pseudanabaenaceae cyanobacterium bins.39]
MDDASIVKVLQEDLENYKVKIQTRHKESQLHILVTREEGDDIDYGSIYDIVQNRINSLAIDGVSDLTVYGRLAGARHPEWQKSCVIKAPLPVIELDLDDLEDLDNLDLGDLDNLTFALPKGSVRSDREDIDIPLVTAETAKNVDALADYDNFKKTIEDDLISSSHNLDGNYAISSQQDNALNDLMHPLQLVNQVDPDIDFDAVNSALDEISQTAKLNSFSKELDQYEQVVPPPITSIEPTSIVVEPPSLNGNHSKNEDFTFDGTTVALPRPLPPPPTKHKSSRAPAKDAIPPASKTSKPLPIVSIIFVTASVLILGACGWLIWERSQQQKYLETARTLQNQSLNAKKVNNLNELTETRNQLQTTVSQLEAIPNTPLSLYASAQTELANLQPKLQEFDQRVTLEQEANKKLELAKNQTFEAAKMVQNPPHHSKIWKSAQAQRQEALQVLAQITPDSMLYAEAKKRIATYQNELTQIGRWVDIQTKAETLVPKINPAAITQLQDLKTKATDKAQFLTQCQPILQPQLNATDAQNLGMSVANLSGYLCAYVWD